MSSIFDNLNNASAEFENFSRDKLTGHNIKTVAYEETDERLAKKEKLNNIRDSFSQFAEKAKLDPKTPIFNGLTVESSYDTSGKDKTHYTRSDIIRIIGNAKQKYIETTTESLLMNTISSVIFEACPIDEDLKKRDDIKQYFYGITTEMYNDMKSIDDTFKPVSFIEDIRELANKLVTAEASIRFDYTNLDEKLSFEKGMIDGWVDAQLKDAILRNEYFDKMYQTESAQILIEHEDAIQAIKDKVTEDLNDYKNSVNKLNGITDAVKPASDEVKDATGEDKEDPEETETSDDGNTDSTSTGDDNNNANPEEGKDDNASGDDNQQQEEKPDDDKPNTDNNAEEGEDLIGTGSNIKKDVKNNGVAADSKLAPSSQKVAEEIEDAAAFANNYTHTFNTGDEKFEEIRLKLYQRLSRAAAAKDADALNAVKNDASIAAKSIQTISDNNNEKYADMAHKFEELVKTAEFEVGKAITITENAVKNGRTVLESFVVAIGKRYFKKIADEEKLNVRTEATKIIENIPGEKVLTEALVYTTALESFNTLRIMDLRKPKVLAEFKKFMNDIKNK